MSCSQRRHSNSRRCRWWLLSSHSLGRLFRVMELWGNGVMGLALQKAEHSQSVRSKEFRPYLVLESDVGHLGHDPFQGKAHREIPGVDDLVGAATVCIVDDVLGVVLGSESAG